MHAHEDIFVHMYIFIYIYIYIYVYVYIYFYVVMFNMHMRDEIIIQVSRNVQILIWETFIYMAMDVEHNETNPTITFHLLHEDFDIHIKYISKNEKIRIVESSSGNVNIHENERLEQ